MKYDSGMKQFHKNIAEAVKAMLRKSELDEVKGLLGDGSPVSLREYLKETHGVSHHGGNKFDCSPQNFSVRFDSFLNNAGDKLLTLSWSQLATFIRNNSELIFEGDKNEDAPIISKDSFEVFANTFDESKVKCAYWIKGNDVLHANTFGGLSFQCELHNQNFCDLSKLRSHTAMCCGDYTRCISYRKAMEEQNNAPIVADDNVPAFDYAVLDADTAAKLENVTAEIFNVRKEYIFTMAKKVAYAHDLLANHYGGKFGAWCESVGISRDTGNNLVRVAELFGNSTVEEQMNLNKLTDGNIKLLYEAARPSAPAELVEQVKSGDITTHKEYIELKKQLDEVKENLEMSKDDAQKAEERAEYAENANSKLSVKNSELEQRIKELENRPVDVAVDVDELNRRVSEAANKMNSEMEHTLAAERRDFADTLNAKDDRIWELEDEVKKLRSSPASAPTAKILAFQMSMEQYKKLLEIVSGSDNSELYKVIQSVKIFG